MTIHALELLRLGEDEIELDVRCSKGTYIRTLAEDLGKALGSGAHGAVAADRGRSLRDFADGDPRCAGGTARTGGYPALDALLLPASSSVSDFRR